MKKQQIVALFVSSLVLWSVGVGLLPLLPLYAEKLGADPSVVGYYLAFCYLAIACGAMAAGWVSDKLGRRKESILMIGLLSVPTTWLIGRVDGILSLAALTGVLWFCGGFGLAMAGILTGLSAAQAERGKYFGILSLTSGLGTLIGGLSTGYIVDHWGYPTLFTILAGVILFWPFATLFVTEIETKASQESSPAEAALPGLGRPFYLLFAASLISAISGFIVVLVRSLLMNDMGYGATAIGSTGAIGGLVTIPIPLLIGWLSDRSGRKGFLYIGYIISAVSVVVLAFSRLLWQFWVFALLQSLSGALVSPVANAYATDLLPPQAIGKGLGTLSTAGWVGGILGFALGGFALKSFGLMPTLLIGTALPIVGMLMLIPIRQPKQATANSGLADGQVLRSSQAD